MPTPVVIATGNTHKAEEIQMLLGPDYACRTLADFPDAPEVEETARTLAGNAALKAISASAGASGDSRQRVPLRRSIWAHMATRG